MKGVISVFPENKEDNLNLSAIPKENREAIVNHTGIRYRHRVKNKQADVQTLFSEGIKELLNTLQWDKTSVDVIVVVTQTAENKIPSVACALQGDLDFDPKVMAYDINLGCSGFVYGLHSCGLALKSLGKSKARAILCCGDISSHLTEDDDLTVRPIFSDAVSVVGVEVNSDASSAYFHFETFGKGKQAIYSEVTKSGTWMRLNGIDIFNYSVQYVPENIKKLYDHFGTSMTETDLFILHQANLIINKSIVKLLGIPKEKAPSTLYEYGNTASASIPITLALNTNSEHKQILLSGFGVGFSIATCLLYMQDPILTKSILLDI
ncbi:MAG: 3-oxoacyl-[acyl-carrier-protein] synthase-3 [Vicingaceae bacterium]|jgi:3-oxoacyl-[acyl-carrier-protein] synthase-3